MFNLKKISIIFLNLIINNFLLLNFIDINGASTVLSPKSEQHTLEKKIKKLTFLPPEMCSLISEYVAPNSIFLKIDNASSLKGDITVRYLTEIHTDAEIDKSIEENLERLKHFKEGERQVDRLEWFIKSLRKKYNINTIADAKNILKGDEELKYLFWPISGKPEKLYSIHKKICPFITIEKNWTIGKQKYNFLDITFRLQLPDMDGTLRNCDFDFYNPKFSGDFNNVPASINGDTSDIKYQLTLTEVKDRNTCINSSKNNTCSYAEAYNPQDREKTLKTYCLCFNEQT